MTAKAEPVLVVSKQPASGPGALDGHAVYCGACGTTVATTSLSAAEGRRLAEQHRAWHRRRGH